MEGLAPEKAAVVLAERKALAVAHRLTRPEAVVVGCDTILLMDGQPCGKPESLDQARDWCRRQRESEVEVVTGHCVVDVSAGRQAARASWSTVRVGPMSDEEIEAYLATGEALKTAGGLTIDGYGAPFIAGIQGDHGTVVGLSLPLLRHLLAEIDISVTSLWTHGTRADPG